MVFRGKNAANERRKLVNDEHCKISLPADAGANSLRIVRQYVHLGSAIECDGSPTVDVPRRVASATGAYAPIAMKIFGSKRLSAELRLRVAHSLVLSRLLYNVHCWSKLSVVAYKQLNAVYMSVIRRIAGTLRFSSQCNVKDYEARKLIGAPSLQCLLIRARLCLLSSIVSSNISSLIAVLSVTSAGGKRLPWVDMLIDDLVLFKKFYSWKLDELGDPLHNAGNWFAFI